MLVKFFNRAVQKGLDEQGLPFYENALFITISRDSTHEVIREADEDDFVRFPETYEAFLKANDNGDVLSGIPIEMWPLATPADVENIRLNKIKTVQELAKLDKSKAPAYIGVLVDKAKDYVNMAGDVGKTAQQIDKLKESLNAAVEQNKQLKEKIKAMQDEKKS